MSFPVGNYELCFCDFFIKEDESGGYLTKWNNVLNHSIKSVNERFCHLVFVDRMLFCQDVMSAAAFVILKCFSVRYFKVWCELTEIIMIQKRQWLDSGFTSASGGVFYDLDYKAISISSEASLIWMLIDLLIQNHILYFAKSVVSDRSNLLSMWLLWAWKALAHMMWKVHHWMSVFRRVFSDRLVDERDMEAFVAILTEKLALLFDQTYHNICPSKQPPIFGSVRIIKWVLNDSMSIKNTYMLH